MNHDRYGDSLKGASTATDTPSHACGAGPI